MNINMSLKKVRVESSEIDTIKFKPQQDTKHEINGDSISHKYITTLTNNKML